MIRNIWAVGRNYAEHAKELGHAVPESNEQPMIFLKAGSSIAQGGLIHLPAFSDDIHFEAEVAFRFGPNRMFSHILVALDLTARDWQNRLKEKGHPWTLAKSFKDACAISEFKELPKDLDLNNLTFTMKVNGVERQRGHTSDMIHKPQKLLDYVVERFPVCEGDLLLTGTPSGVATLRSGDLLDAEIKDVVRAHWRAA